MNGLIYLEPEDVLEIHDAYIDMFGGIKGIRDEGLFSQLCEAPYQEFDGVELFPTVFDKASKYLEGFSRHQVFLDGNKRTAAGAMMIFLRANSIHVVFSKLDDSVNVALALVKLAAVASRFPVGVPDAIVHVVPVVGRALAVSASLLGEGNPDALLVDLDDGSLPCACLNHDPDASSCVSLNLHSNLCLHVRSSFVVVVSLRRVH